MSEEKIIEVEGMVEKKKCYTLVSDRNGMRCVIAVFYSKEDAEQYSSELKFLIEERDLYESA